MNTKIRQDFPATASVAFLDSAAVSILSRPAVRKVEEFMKQAQNYPQGSPSRQYDQWEESLRQTRAQAALLLGAKNNEIALTTCTSDGLNIVAKIIPWQKKDNIVVNNLEYVANIAPWWAVSRRFGVELRVVKHVNGVIEPKDLEKVVDDHTKVIALSSVQWTNGFRADLKAIGRLAKEHDSYFVVDAVQHLGSLSLKVKEQSIDFLSCGGYKWLLCPMGVGIFYCREELLGRFDPPDWGEANTVCPGAGGDWSAWFSSPDQTSIRDYTPLSTASKFEKAGTPNFPGLIALGAELKYLNRLGIKIEQQVLNLNRYLASELSRIPEVEVVSSPEEKHRSGIISFRIKGWPKSHEGLVEFLRQHRVAVSERYSDGAGGIRVSPHFFNNEEDIDRLIVCLNKWINR